MLIPRKDCENEVQKCLVSKMKSLMEIVEVKGSERGLGKETIFILGVFQGVKSNLKM